MEQEFTLAQLEATRKIDDLVYRAEVARMDGERLEDADFEGAAAAGEREAATLYAEAEQIARAAGLGTLFDE